MNRQSQWLFEAPFSLETAYSSELEWLNEYEGEQLETETIKTGSYQTALCPAFDDFLELQNLVRDFKSQLGTRPQKPMRVREAISLKERPLTRLEEKRWDEAIAPISAAFYKTGTDAWGDGCPPAIARLKPLNYQLAIARLKPINHQLAIAPTILVIMTKNHCRRKAKPVVVRDTAYLRKRSPYQSLH